MKEFDYIIIGGGCAGLSLAYELEAHGKLQDKTLAIIEPRSNYKRDKISNSMQLTFEALDSIKSKLSAGIVTSIDIFAIGLNGT